MNIYTFYEPEPILADHENEQLIELWKKNWASHGWEPCVLKTQDAERHPEWQKYRDAFAKLPSVNPGKYEQYCYYRWLAMAAAGGGWMADFDTFNYGFNPTEIIDDLVMASTHNGAVPCLVGGTQKGYQNVCLWISQTTLRDSDRENGKPHISDMIITQRNFGQIECPYVKLDIVRQYGDSDEKWRTSLAVHFPSDVMKLNGYMPKWKYIATLR